MASRTRSALIDLYTWGMRKLAVLLAILSLVLGAFILFGPVREVQHNVTEIQQVVPPSIAQEQQHLESEIATIRDQLRATPAPTAAPTAESQTTPSAAATPTARHTPRFATTPQPQPSSTPTPTGCILNLPVCPLTRSSNG